MMKIVFHSRFPVDEINPRGGIESATCNLLHGLHHIGCDDLHVVTLEKNRVKLSVEQSKYATIHRLPASKWPMILDIFFGPGRRLLKKYIASLRPDIVHFHETHGLAMSNLGFPSVFTLHGFDSENLPTERPFAWRVRKVAWTIAEKVGLGRQRFMISIAPYVRTKMSEHTSAEISDICNAISSEGFSVVRKESAGRIFYAGWVNRRKNALGLVSAFSEVRKHIPGVVLELAGEFSDSSYRAEVEDRIAVLDLNDSVNLLGRISANQIRSKLASAAVFVLPSFQENAPMVVAEAMAAGVPVVTSNVCGMPDMIEDGVSGFLVDPHDVKQIADVIVDLLMSDATRESVSIASKKRAIEQFHPETVAKWTVEFYESAIAAYQSDEHT